MQNSAGDTSVLLALGLHKLLWFNACVSLQVLDLLPRAILRRIVELRLHSDNSTLEVGDSGLANLGDRQ